LIKEIYLYPNGSPWSVDLADGGDSFPEDAHDPNPYFVVKFRNGFQGVVIPSYGHSSRVDLSFKS